MYLALLFVGFFLRVVLHLNCTFCKGKTFELLESFSVLY